MNGFSTLLLLVLCQTLGTECFSERRQTQGECGSLSQKTCIVNNVTNLRIENITVENTTVVKTTVENITWVENLTVNLTVENITVENITLTENITVVNVTVENITNTENITVINTTVQYITENITQHITENITENITVVNNTFNNYTTVQNITVVGSKPQCACYEQLSHLLSQIDSPTDLKLRTLNSVSEINGNYLYLEGVCALLVNETSSTSTVVPMCNIAYLEVPKAVALSLSYNTSIVIPDDGCLASCVLDTQLYLQLLYLDGDDVTISAGTSIVLAANSKILSLGPGVVIIYRSNSAAIIPVCNINYISKVRFNEFI